MAYTTPRTWSAGSAIAAADLNTDVRDNVTELYDRLVAHGITSTTPQPLKSGGYGVSVTRSAQSVPDASDISMAYDTEEWDDAGFHSTVTNTQRITIPTGGDGRYEFTAQVDFASDDDGRRAVWIEKNGATEYNRVQVPAVQSAATDILTSVELDLVAGDYVRCMVRHNAGASINVSSRFQARRTAV